MRHCSTRMSEENQGQHLRCSAIYWEWSYHEAVWEKIVSGSKNAALNHVLWKQTGVQTLTLPNKPVKVSFVLLIGEISNVVYVSSETLQRFECVDTDDKQPVSLPTYTTNQKWVTFKFPEHKATENTERGKDHSRSRQVTRRDSESWDCVCVWVRERESGDLCQQRGWLMERQRLQMKGWEMTMSRAWLCDTGRKRVREMWAL